MKEFKIGIIGLGMVGGVMKKYFELNDYQVLSKDLDHDQGVASADIIFVSVPTPYAEELKGYDLTAIKESLKSLPPGKLVVIKSTVQPGTTEALQKEFPELNLLFNPEFLTEATTDRDFNNPEKQIIGYTEKSKELAGQILDILPEAPYSKIMPAGEAELIKLATNAYMSLKVVYFNQIYDLCQAYDLDYDEVKEGVFADTRVGRSHGEIWHGGFRGFGGKCLPKDLNALIACATDSETVLLFDTVRKINEGLLKRKGS